MKPDARVEPPVGGFGFGHAGRPLTFDRAWLARSSEGMEGKCEISGPHSDRVSCTKTVAPGGGTITASTTAPLALRSPGGIQACRSMCRFIIDVAGGGSMRYACVGLLPSTAQATPRANVQGLGGWMLNVQNGHVFSSFGVTVSGAPPVVLPGGAIEIIMDYDSQKCFIAVYTPEAVAAGYPQPPQSVSQLEFAGRAFPADGTLFPAVTLYMDGVSVRVEEPGTDAADGVVLVL
jgi:hypothetical protein